MEKRPNDLSSRRLFLVLLLEAVVRSPHALGLCCLTVAWGGMGLGAECYWSRQVLPLKLGFLV